GLHRAVVLGRLEVDGVGRACDRAEPARHAFLQAILVAHEHLFGPELGKHRKLVLGIIHRDRLPEHMLQGCGETNQEGSDESHCSQCNRPIRSSKSMPEAQLQLLRPEQILLTTLVVKLAVMAALAPMLVRYRRFRHMLIFERRGWHERLVFVLALGIPLTAGVIARLLLNYKAADLTLEGAFLAGVIAGPYAGAIV